jgi:ribose 1,5-bisphosphokinase
MSDQLIYTIGPSGAGKDSVLTWLNQVLSPRSAVHFARRVIDRPVISNGEEHESLSTEDFVAQRDQQEFALHWSANRHLYGVRNTELESLKCGKWVFVNGSRGYLESALAQFPSMVVLHITAPRNVLESRLLARNRESAEQIAERLCRSETFQPPSQCVFLEVRNISSIEQAGHHALHLLSQLPGWVQADFKLRQIY